MRSRVSMPCAPAFVALLAPCSVSNGASPPNYTNNEIDIYDYTPTKIGFSYSFNHGINTSAALSSVAINPRSEE